MLRYHYSMNIHHLTQGYGTENPDTKAAVVNPANASLLRRFNQHSSMVLRVCDKAAAGAALLANAVNGAASGGGGAALNSLQVNGTAAAAGTKGAELDPPPAKKVSGDILGLFFQFNCWLIMSSIVESDIYPFSQ